MMTFIKNIKQIALIACISLCGCEKMLELYPEDKLTREDYWQVKSDIESVMIGAYSKLQGCVSSFFIWGELRGELVYADYDPDGHRKLVDMQQIAQDNNYSGWGAVYSAINMFNMIVDFAPLVLDRDDTFTRQELDQYVGEAKTMRALCYFYLARSFETFPYITVASQSDEQVYIYPGLQGYQVMDSLINDLKWAEKVVRINYDDVVFDPSSLKTRYEKGRVTQAAVRALLADIYLTKNKYAEAVAYADKLIDDPQLSLLAGNQWFENFYPGNSSESILELQFAREYDNAGEIIKWYSDNSNVDGKRWYVLQRNINTNTYLYWEGADRLKAKTDIRGEGATYPSRFNTGGIFMTGQGIQVWKWTGKKINGTSTSDIRDQSSNDPNWIFYRLSDIYLMKAEALNRLAQTDAAADILKLIRERAGLTEPVSYGDQIDLENQILDERASELAIEGKRWYDLVRIAKRQKNYEVLANRIAENKALPHTQGAMKARLTDSLSWYFPIHRTELDKNALLRQNKYYNIGN